MNQQNESEKPRLWLRFHSDCPISQCIVDNDWFIERYGYYGGTVSCVK